jgi:chromosome segregation ATPase
MTELDELRARQEALEAANEELHEAFRQVDGDSHEALTVAKSNIKLMVALRATQLEHGRVLSGVVTDVAGLKTSVATLDAKVGQLDAKVGHLDAKVGHLDAKVGQLDAKVGRLDAKIDTVDAKAEGLTTAVIGLHDMVSEVLRRLPRPPQAQPPEPPNQQE